MALPAAGVLEVRTTGLDTNSIGFVRGGTGTDWSTAADTPQYSVADGVTAGTTTITSATANFGTDVVDNYIYVQGGTGSLAAVWKRIVSRTNSTTIVVDSSTGIGASTGVTLHIGGPALTIAAALAIMVSENVCWVKGGTYAITTGLSWPATGNSIGNIAPDMLVGYGTTRGDNPNGTNRPLISTSSSITLLTIAVNNVHVESLRFDGGSTASTTGISITNANPERGTILCNVKVSACKVRGIAITNSYGPTCYSCEVSSMASGSTSAFQNSGGKNLYCIASSNQCHGFSHEGNNNANSVYVGCIAYSNKTGGTWHGFRVEESLGTTTIVSCVAYDNSGDGIRAASSYASILINNCILVNNTGYGIRLMTTVRRIAVQSINYNAFYNNTAGPTLGYIAGANDVTLTGDPFTNGAGGDFSLNNTAGAGAACRSVGFPGVMPNGSTTGYEDIGPVHHQDPYPGPGARIIASIGTY